MVQIAKLSESTADRDQPRAPLKRKAKRPPNDKAEKAPTEPAPTPPPEAGHIDVVA